MKPPKFKFIVALSFLFLLQLAHGQSKFGLKVGSGFINAPSSSTMFSEDGKYYDAKIDFIGNSNKKSIGLFMVKDFNLLFAEFDAIYSVQSSEFAVELFNEEGLGVSKEILQENNFELSVVGGINLGNFDLGVGPIFRHNLERSSNFDKYEFIRQTYRKIDAGFQASFAYTFKLLRIQFKIEDMFAKAGEFIVFENATANKLNSKQRFFSLGIGVGF